MTALAETADRQFLWSSTASVLKRRVEIARWVTFAFSILGALLAAIASQLNDPSRMYFAIAGAVLLAVVSFITSRLLSGLQITNWLRARNAAEALKREAYKYAACDCVRYSSLAGVCLGHSRLRGWANEEKLNGLLAEKELKQW